MALNAADCDMRRIKRELGTLGRTIAQLLEMTWEEARLESQGKTKPKVDHDAALEKRAPERALPVSCGKRAPSATSQQYESVSRGGDGSGL